MEEPKPDEVRAQLERLYASKDFERAPKLRRLLDFLVEESFAGRGSSLTEKYIGFSLNESETEDQASGRKGYHSTRVNLSHVRARLNEYFDGVGYRDRVIIKLNPGSFAPAIAYNPITTAMPYLEPAVGNLIVRAKMAIDERSFRGALRAMKYRAQLPVTWENPRVAANMLFIGWVTAPIISGFTENALSFMEMAIARIKASNVEPWECTFVEACVEACYRRNWQKAIDLFEVAIVNSQGEAKYFWWYPALLAAMGRLEEAIGILDSAVRSYLRRNLELRTDLALLQTIAGRWEEAEELLAASLDFAPSNNPRLVYSFAVLLEAQDRLEDAAAPAIRMFEALEMSITGSVEALIRLAADGGFSPAEPDSVSKADELVAFYEGHTFILGMLALIFGRNNDTAAATEIVDTLLRYKAIEPTMSSVEIAIAMIGIGKLDDAVTWLQRAAFDEHDPFAMWFHILPPLRHLREHRGFKMLLRDLKLPAHRCR